MWLWTGILLGGLLAGSMPAVAAAGRGEAERGRAIFNGKGICHYCHGTDGPTDAAGAVVDGGTQLAFPGIAAYGGTKAALELFTKVAAKELGGRKITVNTVSPGYTETDMLSDPTFRTMGVEASPLKRLGTPKDIADVVAFLVSDEGGWITGDTIQAGGGVVM